MVEKDVKRFPFTVRELQLIEAFQRWSMRHSENTIDFQRQAEEIPEI